MGMTKTMLQEDINQLDINKRSRNEIVELFYQRLYNIIDHVKYDINSLRENTVLTLDELKDLYMLTDMYIIQLEETIDRIKKDPCHHVNISAADGQKTCINCGAKIA